jgi:hypothetical protein
LDNNLSNKKQKTIENTILSLVFIVILYFIVKFVSTYFHDIEIKLPKFDLNISSKLSDIEIDTDFLLKKYTNGQEFKYDVIDNNITKKNNLNTNENNVSFTKKIIRQAITPQLVKPIMNEELNVSLKQVDINKSADNKSADNKIMIKKLNFLIKTIASKIKNNIDKPAVMENNETTIRVRITVLKNGNFINVKYLSGNNTLLSNVESALKKVFPIVLNPIILSQFPRYMRFNIDFKKTYL